MIRESARCDGLAVDQMGAVDGRHLHGDDPGRTSREPSRVDSRALAAEARERRRVSEALHDGTQQRLTVLAIGLSRVIERIDSDPNEAIRLTRRLEGETQEALRELRALVEGLEPPVLTDFGLVEALHSISRTFPVSVSFITQGIVRYDGSIEDAVFFTCREALQNTIKHASATSVMVILIDHGDELEFSVEDNGRGFDAALPGGGYATMHRRVESLGGSLTIDSSPGAGTSVHGTIPVG